MEKKFYLRTSTPYRKTLKTFQAEEMKTAKYRANYSYVVKLERNTAVKLATTPPLLIFTVMYLLCSRRQEPIKCASNSNQSKFKYLPAPLPTYLGPLSGGVEEWRHYNIIQIVLRREGKLPSATVRIFWQSAISFRRDCAFIILVFICKLQKLPPATQCWWWMICGKCVNCCLLIDWVGRHRQQPSHPRRQCLRYSILRHSTPLDDTRATATLIVVKVPSSTASSATL